MKNFLKLSIIAWLLAAGIVQAQGIGPPISSSTGGTQLRDEGVAQGGIRIIDCVGVGITCTRSGAVATVAVQNFYLPLGGGTMSGAILFSPDNTIDIAASGATRPRTGYFGTSISAPQIQGGESASGNLTWTSTSNATKGKILFGTSAYDENNDYLGIATASPGNRFQVTCTVVGKSCGLLSESYGLAVGFPQWASRFARGTVGSPTIDADGDPLGRWGWDGYSGTTFRGAAAMRVDVEGTPSASFVPGRFLWFTSSSSQTLPERMRLDSNGNLGIGITPADRLEIDGGNFLVGTDNTYDQGATGATRFRTGYFGTALSAPTHQGGEGSGGNITLSSTSNATKGKLLFGTSAYDEANNRLGILTASPAFDFHLVKAGGIATQGQATFETYDSSGIVLGGSVFNFRAGRGTAASPSVVSSGDVIATLQFVGYGNSAFTSLATIKPVVDGTFTNNTIPGRIEFYTHGGDTSSLTLKLTLDRYGHLVSKGSTPTVVSNDCGTTAQGTITGSSTDVAGSVTAGTLAVTSCKVTFANAWANAPNCVVTDDSSTLALKASTSTTAITIGSATSMSSDKITWICIGNN